MKKIEIIREILLNTKLCVGLENDRDILYTKIESFSIKNPKLFEELIDKKLAKIASASIFFPNMFNNTGEMMLKSFCVFIKQFDQLNY